ncbi:hypothetical protein SAMN04487949_0460 [Halogranum gelatinilyticum]|uniref:RecA-superfamily ATPase, KaiC/GvpD/RAD55 family n=1 Tax=Halogranum gelatinilyticum TaxID=660521 RepID=A0A1G9PPC5_9EURY|nr:hypothetical protein [Halogranum gelatinilyticum]SDM00331.1 hypothetical protein SAMN04487949_0460 [Halogranum gelatinilyticum]
MRTRDVCRGDEARTLDDVLSRLKRRGCALLVTGCVGDDVSARLTRRLLGSPAEQRRRLLVLSGADADRVATRLPPGVAASDPDVRVVDVTATDRSTAVDTPRGAPSDASGPSAIEVLQVFTDAVDALDDGDLDPSELRVAFDPLCPLLGRDDEASARFLRVATALVRDATGMGHFHLPVADDSPRIDALGHWFDARIELRHRDGLAPEQRWHLPEYGTTPWVRL